MKSRLLAHFSISNLIRLMIAVVLVTQSLLTPPSFSRATEVASHNADNSTAKEAAARAVVDANYGKLPLSFEVNRGQAHPEIKFLARAGGSSLLLKATEAVLVLSKAAPEKVSTPGKPESAIRNPQSAIVTMKLVGANPNPRIVGLDEQQARSSYFVGSDPKQWTTDVPNFAKVRYEQVYPGIDLIFYGNPQKLEYDFVVAPGTDPKQIKLSFAGAQKMRMDAGGDLVLQTKAGEVRQHKPVIYQEVNGERREVTGSYALGKNGEVAFQVGAYNTSLPLVIDPVIVYATFFGADGCLAVAVDKDGNAYVSAQIPATPGAFQGNGQYSVSKLNAAGTMLVYSATFVSEQSEHINGLAVDTTGNCYLTGYTSSANFPTTPGAFQTTFGTTGENFYAAFVAKLNPTGSALVYSTFLRGNVPAGNADKVNLAYAIAVDGQGNAYVTGRTDTSDFPVTPGAYQTSISRYPFEPAPLAADVFVTKLNPTGSALVYSTFLGAADNFDVGYGIAVDAAGSAYVSGITGNGYVDVRRPQGGPFPITPGAYRTTDTYSSSGQFLGFFGFVTKFNPQGSALVYSTLIGNVATNAPQMGIALDAGGNAYVMGQTRSSTFPTTPGAFQTALAPTTRSSLQNAFTSKLNAAGSALVYSTYLGGSDGEDAAGIAVDTEGNAYVSGLTNSTNFPQVGGMLQTISPGGGAGTFVSKINTTGSSLIQSIFIPASRPSGVNANGIAIDNAGNAYVVGLTTSLSFQPTPGAYRTEYAPGFVAKISSPRLVQTVSAASYTGTLSSEAIVTAFGAGLATATQVATSTPLPVTLAGTGVKVRDSTGVERDAPLFFVSPTQINYLIPAGTANGLSSITITSSDGSRSVGSSQISTVAPGLFTANASGQGIAAAVALRVKANGAQSFEPVVQFDPAQSQLVAVPIDLGPETDQVFLILYGTGVRNRSSLAMASAKLGGTDASVIFAGAQGDFVGLDQVNVRLPRSLMGRGVVDVVLMADGKVANTVKVRIK